MDQRITEFIAGLRAAGVRISVAESADALYGIEQAGIADKRFFQAALQTTLIKDSRDVAIFEQLFPLYFLSMTPSALKQPGSSGHINAEEQRQFQRMLEHVIATMTPPQLAQLFQAMMTGQSLSNQAIQEMLEHLGPQGMTQPLRMQQSTLREIQFQRLEQALRELLEYLLKAGMSAVALKEIEQTACENQQMLTKQIEHQVEQRMRTQSQQKGYVQPNMRNDLLNQPFEYLTPTEAQDMRLLIARLAARLRSRLALRQRRGKIGTLDAKNTIRANLRFGGVPMIIRLRNRRLKPKLVIICDRSISTERFMSFMLLLIYSLQDQISRTRSFAFIDHIHEMSSYFAELRPEQAIEQVMRNIRPKRNYSTDLGQSLKEFTRDYCDCVDRRTTVIFMGDARNNENDPGLAAFALIKRRARRMIWFNPEPSALWGRYDPGSLSSDMLKYMPMCDAVHYVSNLRQLVTAVDTLFIR